VKQNVHVLRRAEKTTRYWAPRKTPARLASQDGPAQALLNGTVVRNMATADIGSQATRNSQALIREASRGRRILQFLIRFVTGTATTFALATLTLFGLNAGLDYATGLPQSATAEVRHANNPAFGDKLAAACTSGPQVGLLDAHGIHCLDLVIQAIQHFSGASLLSGLTQRLSAGVARTGMKGLQVTIYRLATVWFGNGRSNPVFAIH
jgi:hypothetical protein